MNRSEDSKKKFPTCGRYARVATIAIRSAIRRIFLLRLIIVKWCRGIALVFLLLRVCHFARIRIRLTESNSSIHMHSKNDSDLEEPVLYHDTAKQMTRWM